MLFWATFASGLTAAAKACRAVRFMPLTGFRRFFPIPMPLQHPSSTGSSSVRLPSGGRMVRKESAGGWWDSWEL